MKSFFLFLFGTVILFPFLFTPSESSAGTISPEVRQKIASASPSTRQKVILRLLEPSPVTSLSLEGKSKAERHETVIKALQKKSEESQLPFLITLDRHQKSGKALNIKRFWIVNAIALEATPEVIREISAKHPNVEILSDSPITLFSHTNSTQGTPAKSLNVINAPFLWAKGYTGQSVVVATLDSGVDVFHPDLRSRYRGGGADGWTDWTNSPISYPYDADGHGTGVTGIIVGGNASGFPIGVAPGSQWMAARIFSTYSTPAPGAVISALQWAADPHSNLTGQDGADIINGSFGEDTVTTCNSVLLTAVRNIRALGVLPVFASGNSSRPSIPADYSESVAVGATYNNDTMWGSSGVGPTNCGSETPNPRIKYPDLVAPGVNIMIAVPTVFGSVLYPYSGDINETASGGTGTSFASPHVAGAAALLLSAFPRDLSSTGASKASVDLVLTALKNTAVPVGTGPYPNDTAGYGRIDVSAAFNYLLQTNAPRPPSVTVQRSSSGNFKVSWAPSPAFSTTAITSYSIYRNGIFLGTSPSSPYSDMVNNDMGSYTYGVSAISTNFGTTTQASQQTKALVANLHQGNGVTSNRVDGFDLDMLLEACPAVLTGGSCSASVCPECDITGDGTIDSFDLNVLTTHFGQVMK